MSDTPAMPASPLEALCALRDDPDDWPWLTIEVDGETFETTCIDEFETVESAPFGCRLGGMFAWIPTDAEWCAILADGAFNGIDVVSGPIHYVLEFDRSGERELRPLERDEGAAPC